MKTLAEIIKIALFLAYPFYVIVMTIISIV